MATEKQAKLNSVAFMPKTELPPVEEALKKALSYDRVLHYRQAYRLFRIGEQHGAKGEVHQFQLHEGGTEHFPVEKEQLGVFEQSRISKRMMLCALCADSCSPLWCMCRKLTG
jgi:hypothetical protein